jgi:hypothetical protein
MPPRSNGKPAAPVKKATRRPRRKAGESAAEEKTAEASEAIVEPVEPEISTDRIERFRTPGFTRMRTSWRSDDQLVLARGRAAIEERVRHSFADAFALMYEVYSEVREVEHDDSGEPVIDIDGLPEWKRTSTGGYVEDWDRLTSRQREHFIYMITTRLFAWEQIQADMWYEAMMAKGQFEERHGLAYDETEVDGKRDRIEDRAAHASSDAAEERYFAIYLSALSRRADAVVRSMDRLCQRLKDTMS